MKQAKSLQIAPSFGFGGGLGIGGVNSPGNGKIAAADIEEISAEEAAVKDEGARMGEFVEYLKVQDRAIIGRLTNMVKIRDPCTGHLIVSIRDPKVDINPYSSSFGVIDMQDSIKNASEPVFNSEEPPMSFEARRLGWHTMLDLIRTKRSKKMFWEFIERLKNVRLTYN